jgi:hypothetical protein
MSVSLPLRVDVTLKLDASKPRTFDVVGVSRPRRGERLRGDVGVRPGLTFLNRVHYRVVVVGLAEVPVLEGLAFPDLRIMQLRVGQRLPGGGGAPGVRVPQELETHEFGVGLPLFLRVLKLEHFLRASVVRCDVLRVDFGFPCLHPVERGLRESLRESVEARAPAIRSTRRRYEKRHVRVPLEQSGERASAAAHE